MPRTPRALLGLSLLLTVGCGATFLTAPPHRATEAPRLDAADLERRVLSELDRVRRAHGREPLRPDSALAAIARAHSEAMLARGFFAHRDPEGRRGGDRAREAGYPFRTFGENIFRSWLYDTVVHTRSGERTTTDTLWHTPDGLAARAAASWMESPGHRDNMLSASFDRAGVGVALGPASEVFVTLNLSVR